MGPFGAGFVGFHRHFEENFMTCGPGAVDPALEVARGGREGERDLGGKFIDG